jgi:uncharacterized protein
MLDISPDEQGPKGIEVAALHAGNNPATWQVFFLRPSSATVSQSATGHPNRRSEERFMDARELPGSHGEHLFQHTQGSVSRGRAFYQKQLLDYLNADMQQFIGQQEMFILASADARGECDCSFRAGEKGFVRALDDRTLLYAEYRGNGVFATLGNISENPHAAFLFIDFFQAGIGLHVNGKASICSAEDLVRARCRHPAWPEVATTDGRALPELWIMLAVEEAYIHCSKHVPLLIKRPKEIDWGTDDVRKKGGDYFHAKQSHKSALDSPASDTCAR